MILYVDYKFFQKVGIKLFLDDTEASKNLIGLIHNSMTTNQPMTSDGGCRGRSPRF